MSYIETGVIPILSTQFVLNSKFIYQLHREISTSILYFPFGLIHLSRQFYFTHSYSHITLFTIQFQLNFNTSKTIQHTQTLTNIHHPHHRTTITGQLSPGNYPRTTITGRTYRYIYTTYKRITQTIFNRATRGKRDEWWYSHVQRRTTVGVFKFAHSRTTFRIRNTFRMRNTIWIKYTIWINTQLN